MDEKLRILEMIQSGKLTADEGMQLLNSLEKSHTPPTSFKEQKTTAIPFVPDNPPKKKTLISKKARKGKYKKLWIDILDEANNDHVKIWLPLNLLKFSTKFAKMIPADTQSKMSSHNVYISDLDLEGILNDLESGHLDNPEIVNIASNENGHRSYIKIYFE